MEPDCICLAVLHAFGWLLPVVLVAWFCLVLDSHGLNPFKALKRSLAPIPPVGRAVFCVLLVGLVVYGSTKSGDDTNSPPLRLSAPRRTPRLADVVTAEDVAHGWHRKRPEFSDYYYVGRVDFERKSDDNSRPLMVGGRMDLYKQVWHIDAQGTYRTDKFGHWISRSRNCVIKLDGTTIQTGHP